MTDITSDQKQKAKTAAANLAVASNDMAVVLGAAGVVAATTGTATGVGAPAGIGVGAILGLASFGAWFMGNRYQRLANDPPSDDYQTVTVSSAAYVENTSFDEPSASYRSISGEFLVMGDAVSSLVLSLERYDGATAGGATDAAETQAQAVLQNAAAAAASLTRLQTLAATLNTNWTSQSSSLDWTTATLTGAQGLITDNCGTDITQPAPALADLVSRIQNVDPAAFLLPLSGEQHPLFLASALPDKPDALFGSDFLSALASAGDAIASLGQAIPNS